MKSLLLSYTGGMHNINTIIEKELGWIQLRYWQTISVLVAQSVVSNSLQPHEPQTSLSMEFSRQEYWSRLSFPSPGDLPNPGIEPGVSLYWRRILYLLSHPTTVHGFTKSWTQLSDEHFHTFKQWLASQLVLWGFTSAYSFFSLS